MKKPNRYVCRKCTRSNFRNSMEFTKHLKKCKGPISPSPMDQAVAMMGTMHASSVQQIKDARRPFERGLVAMLRDVSRKAGELQAAVDQIIKRLS